MNRTISFEIDAATADKAESRLQDLGFNMEDGAKQLFKILAENPMFSEVLIRPNQETIEAMLDSENGTNLYEAKDVEDLFKQCGVEL